MDYIKAKREIADQEAAISARNEAKQMIEREKLRQAPTPTTELNQENLDPTRIAYIGVHGMDDGFKSDIYVLPEDPHAPLIAVPCSLDTAKATDHYNLEGKGEVALTHSNASRIAVNIKTISRLEMTPNAITNALTYWKTSDAPSGVPVHLSEPQIHAISAHLAETDTESAVAKLRAIAEQGLVERRKPTAAKHQLAS